MAQTGSLSAAALLVAAGATGLSAAQRALSNPARQLRRRIVDVDGTMTGADGTRVDLTRAGLLLPLERALRALSWGVMAVAAGLAVARLTS